MKIFLLSIPTDDVDVDVDDDDDDDLIKTKQFNSIPDSNAKTLKKRNETKEFLIQFFFWFGLVLVWKWNLHFLTFNFNDHDHDSN